jgi:phage tail-like protein
MAVYTDPLRAFRFLVEVENSGTMSAAFAQFSGVKMEVQTIQARSGADFRGVAEYVPVLTKFAPVTLTKGVIGDNDFMDWLFAASASHSRGPTGTDLYRTINVIALDDEGNRGVTWSLRNAMPIGYELSPMDGSQSGVLSESLTFAITGMERTTGTPKTSLLEDLRGLFRKSGLDRIW